MKIAIVVGHNARAQGAVRVVDGVPEFQWCGELAAPIANEPDVEVFYRTPGAGQIERVYAQVDASGARCSVEFHFNAFANPTASGTETLSSGSSGSLALCRLIQPGMVRVLGLPDRGIHVRKGDERGAVNLRAGRCPAALVEPFFGSNPHDCAVADANKRELAFAIVEGARAFCATLR